MQVSKNKALELIDEKIKQFDTILEHADHSNIYSQEYREVSDDARSLIRELFSKEESMEFRRNVRGVLIASGEYDSQRFEDYKKHLGKCISQMKAYKNRVQNFWGEEKATTQEPINELINILSKFPSVARQLSFRHDNRDTLQIKDEYDVQDLLHALLKIHFDDIRREEWTPSYAGGSSRIDFLLKNEEIVVEVKKTRDSLRDKEIGNELIVDIAKYSTHPDCKVLVCFIYDPEVIIRNPIGLENDLNKKSTDSLSVVTRIEPKN